VRVLTSKGSSFGSRIGLGVMVAVAIVAKIGISGFGGRFF